MYAVHMIVATIADEMGLSPAPKVTGYANCCSIALRNGDGDRVLITVGRHASVEEIRHAMAQAHKLKADVMPDQHKLQSVLHRDEGT